MDLILPDVNVLVYVADDTAREHAVYSAWLEAVRARDTLALPDPVLLGFIRVVTDPRILGHPVSATDALAFVEELRTGPRTIVIGPTESTWAQMHRLTAVDRRIRGQRIPDAWLAALAISHGARLATADRDFARYEGLDWFDPVRG